MSFFDEVDEPQQPPRSETRRPRGAARRPGGNGSGRPPGNHQQSVQTRRLILAVVLVVVVILMAVLIHGCQASAAKNSLRTYNSAVSAIMTSSNSNGKQLFQDLSSGASQSALQHDVLIELGNAGKQLSTTEGLSVPGQMSTAQQYLLLTMRERRDGISQIAHNIPQALSTSTSKDGVYAVTVGTSFLYSSDVVYKGYVAPDIAKALHGSNILVCPAGLTTSCGVGSASINAGQIVPNLSWLQQSYVAKKLAAPVSATVANGPCPSGKTCGDGLNSVSVGGKTLDPSTTNTVSTTPAPTFVFSVTNTGTNPEYSVSCELTVQGKTSSQKITKITPGQTQNCSITLKNVPTEGHYSVTAKVAAVPGETNVTNNTFTYTIAFT